MTEWAIGSVSACLASITSYPIDVIKTRFQTSNKGVVTVVKDIAKKNGLKGFYKGLSSNLCTYPIFWGIYFQAKSIDVEPTENKHANKIIKSLGAAGFATCIVNPLFVFKVRFQTVDKSMGYTNLAKSMWRNEGITSFYKGLGPSLINNFKLGVQFPLYEYLLDETKDWIPNKSARVFISSSVAKVVANNALYPMDRIRTIQRNTTMKMSIKQAGKQIIRQEGFLGLYRGMMLYNMRSIPEFVLLMVYKEFITDMVNKS